MLLKWRELIRNELVWLRSRLRITVERLRRSRWTAKWRHIESEWGSCQAACFVHSFRITTYRSTTPWHRLNRSSKTMPNQPILQQLYWNQFKEKVFFMFLLFCINWAKFEIITFLSFFLFFFWKQTNLGGFYPAPPAFMRKLRELCDKHGICLIADEVQTGAGRTGTFFAMVIPKASSDCCLLTKVSEHLFRLAKWSKEQMGVAADITTFAKSVGGGLPISGVVISNSIVSSLTKHWKQTNKKGIIGKAEIMDSVVPGGLGGT